MMPYHRFSAVEADNTFCFILETVSAIPQNGQRSLLARLCDATTTNGYASIGFVCEAPTGRNCAIIQDAYSLQQWHCFKPAKYSLAKGISFVTQRKP